MNLSPDAKRKQNALFHCLSEILPKAQLLEAMVLWQDKHAHKAGFSVRYFADDVAALTGGRHTPKTLTLTMVSAIANNAVTYADAAEEISAYRLQIGRYMASTKATQVTAFNLLISKLLLLAGRDIAEAAKAQVKIQCLADDSFSGTLKTAMAKALRAPDFELKLLDVPVAPLKALVNLFYVALCEEVGPIHADRLLSQSLARLESNGGAQYTDVFKALV